MKWNKKGLILSPDKNLWWSQLYCMMPTPVFLAHENIIRVFFGTTDKDRFGRATYVDLNADNPSEIIYTHPNIIADLGGIGTFDDSGVIPSSVVVRNDVSLMYYVGFQRTARVPYMLFCGLLQSAPGSLTEFTRYSKAPILDRHINNPFSNAAPFVLFDEVEKMYKMWFWLGKEWTTVNGKLYIRAEIHYTTSEDGLNWTQESTPCIIPDTEKKEFSVGRPWIIKTDGSYKMFYSIRHVDVLYRIGFAESADGINWSRKDNEIGIDVSESGWDSEMICYPAVMNVKGKTYLFYNGNNNGETGFGFAELENE